MALKVLTIDELKASPGKFRAVTFIDSEPYHIGDDADSPAAAMKLCLAEQKGEHDLFQIFNDKGVGCITGTSDGTCMVSDAH